MFKKSIIALFIIAIFPQLSLGQTVVNCTGSGTPLQAAVDTATTGTIILVNGNCVENVLIRNEKQRITIDGGGIATIVGATNTIPVFNVRGKGILIQNFNSIQGGLAGIHVNRGSNAVIHNNNLIQGASFGILVDQLSFAAITGNTITGNAYGVFVSAGSTVRIGYNEPALGGVPNTIASNSQDGVVIERNSHAVIIGNTVSANTHNGIDVSFSSQAEISSNTISVNGRGVGVRYGSGAQFSGNTGGNAGAAINCGTGGYITGNRGSLFGSDGVIVDLSCFSDLTL